MNYTGDSKHNVFVPSFAPQYRDMVARGGILGVSLEEPARGGVWVPSDWLGDVQPVKKTRWQPFTAEALLAMYPPKQPKEGNT